MKKLVALLTLMVVALGATGCNTMKGMGRDVERGGEKMQDAAQGAQNGSSNSSRSGSQ